MDVQEIFDLVIASGHYGKPQGVEYMCIALENAAEDDIISQRQLQWAKAEIDQYLCGHSSLRNALQGSGHPWSPTDCLMVYMKWSLRRPQLAQYKAAK